MKLIDKIKAIEGMSLDTPSGRSSFLAKKVSSDGVTLKVGMRRKSTIFIPTICWEGIIDFLKKKDWVEVGAIHEKYTKIGSLDEYVQKYTHGTSAASYVASMLEKISLVQLDRKRPNKIKLIYNC